MWYNTTAILELFYPSHCQCHCWFWEEYQAGNAIAALKARLALTARVKRDNSWKVIPAREVVPGDILRVRIGEIVPADVRLLEKIRFLSINRHSLANHFPPQLNKETWFIRDLS